MGIRRYYCLHGNHRHPLRPIESSDSYTIALQQLSEKFDVSRERAEHERRDRKHEQARTRSSLTMVQIPTRNPYSCRGIHGTRLVSKCHAAGFRLFRRGGCWCFGHVSRIYVYNIINIRCTYYVPRRRGIRGILGIT